MVVIDQISIAHVSLLTGAGSPRVTRRPTKLERQILSIFVWSQQTHNEYGVPEPHLTVIC